jgi:hypothetical protein
LVSKEEDDDDEEKEEEEEEVDDEEEEGVEDSEDDEEEVTVVAEEEEDGGAFDDHKGEEGPEKYSNETCSVELNNTKLNKRARVSVKPFSIHTENKLCFSISSKQRCREKRERKY